jgi:2-dehydropantoate 2-reductase
MLIDIENNLPTEIDYLNGRIVEYGRKHSVPTPTNETITTLINLLERKSK